MERPLLIGDGRNKTPTMHVEKWEQRLVTSEARQWFVQKHHLTLMVLFKRGGRASQPLFDSSMSAAFMYVLPGVWCHWTGNTPSLHNRLVLSVRQQNWSQSSCCISICWYAMGELDVCFLHQTVPWVLPGTLRKFQLLRAACNLS